MPDIGFKVQPFRGSSGFPLASGFIGALVLSLLGTSGVQAQNTPTSNSGRNKPTVSAVSPVPSQEVAPPPVVPPPLPTAEQKPPQLPVVAWDGQQLTIDADNSTLAAVLLAIRDRTGASVEIPSATSGERVFVHLGPGPPRDVISSLLYGTPFDYVVETGDDDPDTLRRVVLTARGLDDNSTNLVVAGATNTGEASLGGSSVLAAAGHRSGATDDRSRSHGARMMPGWASSGKPEFQAEAEAALAAEQAAAQDSAAVEDSAAAKDSAASKDSASAQESAAAKDSAAAQESIAAQDSTAGQQSVTAADPADATRVSNSSPSTSDSDDSSGIGQAIQNMTKMFEQRRQIQAQQKQPPQPSSN